MGTRALLPATIVLSWFFWFAGNGILADFTPDDMMNLEYYWSQGIGRTSVGVAQVVTRFFRPLGGVFYLAIFHAFGLDPLPFRIACFALLLANMVLFFRFFHLLSGRKELAWVAVFLSSYHAWFVDLYHSSGTVYDLLCAFFYVLGFNAYFKVRSGGRLPGFRQTLFVVLCYAAALDSKELAVTFPLFLLAYELLYHPPRPAREAARWLLRECRTAWLTGLITLPYVLVKTTGGPIAANPAYTPRISAGAFLDTFHLYLNPLLYQDHFFKDSNTIQLMAALLAVAMVSRRRDLVFAWLFAVFSALPFIFIPHYAAFFMYLPLLGWALLGAGLLLVLRDGLLIGTSRLSGLGLPAQTRSRIAGLALVMIPAAAGLATLQSRAAPQALHQFRVARVPISPLFDELRSKLPELPEGSAVWFRSDPFPRDSYTLQQAMRLFYRRRELSVVRGGQRPEGPAVFLDYDGGQLRVLQ